MSQEERKATLRANLTAARDRTLWLLDQVPEEFLKRRVHSFYSPIGWHFGHIGRTEEFWVISEALKRPVLNEAHSFLFADLPENPKDNRVHLPSREEIVEYLGATRRSVLDALEEANLDVVDPLVDDGYGWEFALQHECQHQETIAEMLCLIHKEIGETGPGSLPWLAGVSPESIEIPGGSFHMGSEDLHNYDNEKGLHEVNIPPFIVDKYPVTAFRWSEFMADGGYRRTELWSEEGWQWREQENATAPEYWVSDEYHIFGPTGARPIHPDEPVSSLSHFEAEAYCRWAGKRLLTEAEWEYLADDAWGNYPWGADPPTPEHASYGLNRWEPGPVGRHPKGQNSLEVQDLAGGVWEWTSSRFLPYPGFEPFPYDGYSLDHMLGEHFVCRGGSWATAAPILRRTFRNWYVPTYRQGFLGMRCAEL